MLGVLLFAGVLYGALALFLLTILRSSSGLEDAGTVAHYVAWSVNGVMLLLVTPARLGQKVARDRELGTLEQLRLTGLSGRELAAGELASVLVLPLLCLALSAPALLFGCLGDGGPVAAIRGYAGLLACLPVYTLLGALIGFGAKKAQNAGAGALFACLLLTGASGMGAIPRDIDWHPLGLLGPWGAGLATTHDDMRFAVGVAGGELPGELLQIPLCWLLTHALLRALGRRLAGEPGVALGREGAAALLLGAGLLAALTLPRGAEELAGWRTRWLDPDEALAARLVVLFLASLPLAVETPLGWRELVRGLARRDRDDPVRPDESQGGWRWALGPGLLLGSGLLLLPGALACTPRAPLGGLLLGVLVALGAWATAALAFQAGILWARDQGQPRLLAGLGLLALWLGPLFAGSVLKVVGPSRALAELAVSLNPIVTLLVVAQPGQGAGLPPLGAAVVSLGVHGLACWGLVSLIQNATRRAQELADSMVALPADAWGAPGTLTKRCAAGHLYAEEWQSCPHCPVNAPY